MNLDNSRRSDNVIDYRGVPLAAQPLSPDEVAEQFAELQSLQRFRAKVLLGIVAAYVAVVLLREARWL